MASTTSPRPTPRPTSGNSSTRLPLLFGQETQLFGWQGLTAVLPASWNLGYFGGKAKQGQLRIDDEDGPRLEIRWETPPGTVDLDRSIEKFLESMERAAKKRKVDFKIASPPKLVSKARKRKEQLVQFGWVGQNDEPTAHGWGVAWHCGDCGRVVVAHMMGRGGMGDDGTKAEKQDKVQNLASEVLASLECHGNGGWQTWSVFGCRMEIPEEFELARASLMAGHLQWEWVRPKAPGLFSFLARDERLTFARWSLAAVLLQHRTLLEWAQGNAASKDKKTRWSNWQETEPEEAPEDLKKLRGETLPPSLARAQSTVEARGAIKDLRLRFREVMFDFILRRRRRARQMLVWHDPQDNKVFAFSSDVQPSNEHIRDDILDSLDCS
ncbi:MAG TPA: hypothetical protein VF681_15820 [Abditibacteriaceae bacterium]|jgi:hypothetical protein